MPEKPESKRVWIVQGHTGEYSDHREWLVCYFYTEAEAREKLGVLTAHMNAARAAAILAVGEDSYKARTMAEEAMKPFDPDFRCDYTGAEYMVTWVDAGTL